MVNEEQQNPLSGYFRGTSTYIKLPSCGFYNDEGDIETSENGEIEIYPMTTSDELLFKSPDALLNGEAIAKVIQSCAPGIKNVKNLPMNDIEVLLLAVRQATYGSQIDFTSQCPKCENVKEFGIDITWLLDSITTLEPNAQVKLENGLIIKIKPYTYSSSVKAALLAFNEGKFLQMLIEEDLSDEEKAEKATVSYKKAVDLTIELLSKSIVSMHDKDGKMITDNQDHINEWLNKSSRNDTKEIEKEIKILNETGVPKEIEVDCEKCDNVWKTAINFDPSHFFGQSS